MLNESKNIWDLNMSLFAPPTNSDLVKESVWAVHEAAFGFSDTWPVKVDLPSFSAMPKALNRSFLYVPADFDSVSLQPEKYGKKFSRLFSEMMTAIGEGILPAIFAPIWPGISLFVTSQDAIHWALMSGKMLPNTMQSALQFRQKESPKQLTPYYHKIRTKLAAQIILNNKPHLKDNLEKLLKEPLLNLGTHGLKRHPKSLRNDINTLFEDCGISGRRKQEIINGRSYTSKAMSEIIEIDSLGIPCYCFALLIEAVSRLTIIKLYGLDDPSNAPSSMPIDQIKNDAVMKLYRNKSPHMVEGLIDRLIMSRTIEFENTLKCLELRLH